MPAPVQIRPFAAYDIPSLRRLMMALAEFEGYASDFAVSEADLAAHGLCDQPRFRAFIADAGGEGLLGMAVCYVIPWTYDLKPTLVLKEMFVDEAARGRGVGRALFDAVVAEGERIGAARLNWTVLPDNAAAKTFYRQAGGRPDANWEPWTLSLSQQTRTSA